MVLSRKGKATGPVQTTNEGNGKSSREEGLIAFKESLDRKVNVFMAWIIAVIVILGVGQAAAWWWRQADIDYRDRLLEWRDCEDEVDVHNDDREFVVELVSPFLNAEDLEEVTARANELRPFETVEGKCGSRP